MSSAYSKRFIKHNFTTCLRVFYLFMWEPGQMFYWATFFMSSISQETQYLLSNSKKNWVDITFTTEIPTANLVILNGVH